MQSQRKDSSLPSAREEDEDNVAKSGHECPEWSRDAAFDSQEHHWKTDGDTFGPALPPGFTFPHQEDHSKDPVNLKCRSRAIIGPSLPPPQESIVGCVLPPVSPLQGKTEDECDEIIGPMPATGPCPVNIGQDVEDRARRMKEKLQGGGTNVSSREAWMIELPPERTGFSTGARTFRRRAGEEVGDRSVWTDTPVDLTRKAEKHGAKNNKSKHGDVKEEQKRPSEEELKTAAVISDYNETHRSTSLMELHSRAAKRRAVDELGTTPARRPFDRDHDLAQPRSTAKDRRELVQKSMHLDSRFSHSRGSMFL
uniref:GPALPP motifs-containing protein 1 n=1 Tax=Myxine glutinosa TaxID=7769 RepID=UPI00358EA656